MLFSIKSYSPLLTTICPPFWIIVSKLVWYTLKPVWPVPNKICPPFWIIKSNQSQNQSDQFDSASWLVLRQAFVLSLYKRDITRLVGRYVHSTATHTSLLKTHVIFNNKTLKTIKQYICIILFSLSISLTFTYTTCISLNHSKPPIYPHGSYLIIIAH